MSKEGLFQNLPEHERRSHLTDNAYKVETMNYRRYFSEEELGAKRADFVRLSVEYNREEEEINEKIQLMKSELKAKKKVVNALLDVVDKGFEEANGEVFMMDNQAEGTMSIYDEIGQLIQKRPLRPEERQLFISGNKSVNF